MSRQRLEFPNPLRGAIVYKWICCGKPGCRCVLEGRLHGPYPHLQWWENGKLKTKYLNKKIVDKVREKLEESKKKLNEDKNIRHNEGNQKMKQEV